MEELLCLPTPPLQRKGGYPACIVWKWRHILRETATSHLWDNTQETAVRGL